MFSLTISVWISIWIASVSSQDDQLLAKLACIAHEQCGPCLAAAPHCRWCAHSSFRENASYVPRCNDYDSLIAAGCASYAVQVPLEPVNEVLQNKTLQDMQLNSTEPVVQIQPQRIKLSLRPKDTTTIKFTYRPAKNYPLDLYYLMDLTYSMKDDKETLVSLRDDLPTMLKNLTDNFRLGFGSFAEKPLMPYVSIDEKRRRNPCIMEENYDCEPAYSFHHQLQLTSNVSEFIARVNRSSVTGNLDNAEAGLDALTQSIVCGGVIGWSGTSRKVVILATDGLLHTAGDGKLGGAMQRSDDRCHLDADGFASADQFDYPSLGQLHRLLDEYKVNVIFAVTEDTKNYYDGMHKLMEEYTYIGKLEADSSNILNLVKKGYLDIVSNVNFKDNSEDGPVKLRYFTNCGDPQAPITETSKCSGVEYGKTYDFEVQITLESCPQYEQGQRLNISISESQLGIDSLKLDVELLCGCSCQSDTKNKSSRCPENSREVCGVCECIGNWSGPNCDCLESDGLASSVLASQCRDPEAKGPGMVCSAAGDCLCGKCYCDRGYSGKYCQCKPCPVSPETGYECGGSGRGGCDCGMCVCAAGWEGNACSCPTRTDTCLAPTITEVCSGHGDCVCGECRCREDDGIRYVGQYCETCASCANPLCAKAEPCVLCALKTNCTDACFTPEANYTVQFNVQDGIIQEMEAGETGCVTRVEENDLECEYGFTYKSVSLRDVAVLVRSKKCAQPARAMIMTGALMIMAAVIFGGIIIIMVFKSAQIVADRRAYAKFYEESQRSMLAMNDRNTNPLYISPISQFTLPESFPRDKNTRQECYTPS